MEKLIDIIKAAYGTGFVFVKEITIPWINRHTSVTVVVTAKAPTSFNFSPTANGGFLKFEKGILITIKEVGLQTSLTGIDFDADKATFKLSGFPDLTYTFTK